MSDWPGTLVYFSSVVSCQSSVASRAAISSASIFLNTQANNVINKSPHTVGAFANRHGGLFPMTDDK